MIYIHYDKTLSTSALKSHTYLKTQQACLEYCRLKLTKVMVKYIAALTHNVHQRDIYSMYSARAFVNKFLKRLYK